MQGKAPSTIKKYSGAYSRWSRWASSRDEVPTKPIHVALYLAYFTQTANTPSPVEEAVNALSCVHRMATVEDVTVHPLVVQV